MLTLILLLIFLFFVTKLPIDCKSVIQDLNRQLAVQRPSSNSLKSVFWIKSLVILSIFILLSVILFFCNTHNKKYHCYPIFYNFTFCKILCKNLQFSFFLPCIIWDDNANVPWNDLIIMVIILLVKILSELSYWSKCY